MGFRKTGFREMTYNPMEIVGFYHDERTEECYHRGSAITFLIWLLVMDEPKNYEQAVSCAEKEEWLKTMNEEYQTMFCNDTWGPMDPPAGHNIIGSK